MKLIVNYDPVKDAENYFRGFYDSSILAHGRKGMKEKLLSTVTSDKLKKILINVEEKSIFLDKVTGFLSNNSNCLVFDRKAKELEEKWNDVGSQIIFQLNVLYGIVCPFDKIYIDLTTLPFCPYDFKKRQIFVHASVGIQTQLAILSHELNHFYFYWVYSSDLWKRLGMEKFELLKESMTIFTNPAQLAKPAEIELRQLFIEKGVRNIAEAVALALEHWGK